MLTQYGTSGTAALLGTTARTVRKKKAALGLNGDSIPDAPGPNAQTFTLDNLPAGAAWTPESLLTELGLNPDEWKITNVKARGGHYGNPDDPNSQIRLEISCVPLFSQAIKLPQLNNWKPLPKPKARKKTDAPKTSVVIGDHHCPNEDRKFHTLFCQWLKDEQPDLIEINGDLLDFADISRHRQIPNTGPGGTQRYNNTVNECLQAAFNVLLDYRTACPNAQIRLKFGNHCMRLFYSLIDNLKGLYDITAANEEVPALSLKKLLHLDELHVELIEKEWDKAKTRIGKRLTALHGYSTSKNPGGKMLTDLSGSTLQGHSHRLSLIYRTSHHPDDGTETRLAGECGCACEIDGGLDYANDPDWQQGAMLVKTWSDDDFTVAPIVYLPGRMLLPDGRRYVS